MARTSSHWPGGDIVLLPAAFDRSPLRKRSVLALGCIAFAAIAQDNMGGDGAAELQVLVLAPRPGVFVGGYPGVPIGQLPLQLSLTGAGQMQDLGVRRLSDIKKGDASIADSYNTEGYWDFLSVRGFVLDNRFDYRREGLPISAETSMALDNKAGIEVLKGTSGFQSGIGSPGGLVNLVVKRPTDTAIREVFVGWLQNANVLVSADLGDRFGEGRALGVRVNAAYENIDPRVRAAKGSRHLLALALDWRLAPDKLLEAELESARRSQPVVPGFSLLGSRVPAPGDATINMNNQPWSQASSYDATMGTLRWTQRLDARWKWTAHAGSQQLKNDERTAYPLTCLAERRFDRYCSDGSFDLYDYRHLDQKRRTDALDLALVGSLEGGRWQHRLSLGLQFSESRTALQRQAFNYAGTGNIDGTLVVQPAPATVFESANRNLRSREVNLREATTFNRQTTLWAGLRHRRQGVARALTDGTGAAGFSQSYTSPWLALSHRFDPANMVYASWGGGYEFDQVPDLPRYINRGQLLRARRSQQFEIGAKGQLGFGHWSTTLFDIERPVSGDIGSCLRPDSCTLVHDGSARHSGLETAMNATYGNWGLAASMLALRARRDGSADASLNGRRPANVPALSVKLQLKHRINAVPGLDLLAAGRYEGARMVLPDNSLSIPAVKVIDLALSYAHDGAGRRLVWRAGVDNLLNRRQWRESPYVYGHAYLFPQPARNLSLSLQARL